MQGYAFSGKSAAAGWMLLFPGQGLPAIGMGCDVCDISAATREVWDCASDISGHDVRKLCAKGPMTRLSKTNYQQLAVTTVNVAMLTALRERQPLEIAGCAGHSAGEYTALWAAGVLDLDMLFRAITLRANLMQALAQQHKGAMYVVKGLSRRQVEQRIAQLELTGRVSVACENSLDQQVVGGEVSEVKILINDLTRDGHSTLKLAVNGAWHTWLMGDGVEQMRTSLASLTFNVPKVQLFMNLSAQPENDTHVIRENLALHLINTVRWRENMDNWHRHGMRRFLEVSNKKFLGALLNEHYSDQEPMEIRHYYDLQRPSNVSQYGM